MHFVYHAVPENMHGDKLLPLNKMDSDLEDIKKKALEKYKGREELLERRIELLDCLWNDVVQFLPLDPQKVYSLQKELGLIDKIYPYKFYKIPISSFDPEKTAVYFKTAPGYENYWVEWMKDVDFNNLQTIPKPTIEYYKSLIGTGELPFNYQFIPHVLYKGTIDISDAEIIELTD
ncbi:hypothetical protein KDA00_00645 [Candidatus Saccharibacteria bacterium]|nr:hypothetical protein [Candidatus Saccharibacteria bacterium]